MRHARSGFLIITSSGWRRRSTERLDHHFDNGKVYTIVCRPQTEGGAVITYDDVTEAREGQKIISHMAFHDALTGLANRRSLAATQ
jgi:hypothetical protein